MVDEAQILENSTDYQLRCDLNLASARMVEGGPVPSLHAFSGRFGVGLLSALNADPTIYNALRGVVMAATNQIAGGKPQPKVTASGGDQTAHRRAAGMTSFLKAVRRTNRADSLYPKVWFMALSSDLAGMHYYESNGRILMEPVFANELIFNPNESLMAMPRTTRRRRFMDQSTLLAMFGKGKPALREAIEQADTIDLSELGLPSDMLRIYDTWRVPSMPGAKDGKHVMAMATADGAVGDEGLIVNEPWVRARPPIDFVGYEAAMAGPYARSLASQLAPLQISLNRNLYKAEQNLRLVAVPRVFWKTGSSPRKATFGNMPGDFIEGNERPEFLLPEAVGSETWAHIDRTEERMYQVAGMNRQLAQGQKPPGLNSSVALQTHTDLVAKRQQIPQENYEEFNCVSGSEQIIWLAEDMHERGLKLSVMANDGDALEKIDYADVRLDEGEFVVEIQPQSPLPSTPAGKVDFALQLASSSSPELQARAAQMLDTLDPEAELSAATAVKRAIDGQLEEIVEFARYHGNQPEPYFGQAALKEGVMRAQAMYAQGRINKVPQKNLDLLAQWMDDATQAAGPAPSAAAPPQPAQALAVGPTPVEAAPLQLPAPVVA
jgi:hypothetical protein